MTEEGIKHEARCPACGRPFFLTLSRPRFWRKGGGTKTTTCLWCGQEVAFRIPDGHVFKNLWYSMDELAKFMQEE